MSALAGGGILKIIGSIIGAVLLLPFVLLFLICSLVVTPFDYLTYKKSRYYKDTHEKYSWLCTSSYYIKLYDLIKNEHLPIDYYRADHAPITGYGYFVYKDILILNDYEPCYDVEKKIWTVEVEDEYIDIKDDVEAAIERCNEFLKAEVCQSAVVLIDADVYNEHPDVKYEKLYFATVNGGDVLQALKAIIEEN